MNGEVYSKNTMRFLGDMNQAKVITKLMFLIDGFQRVCTVLGTFNDSFNKIFTCW